MFEDVNAYEICLKAMNYATQISGALVIYGGLEDTAVNIYRDVKAFKKNHHPQKSVQGSQSDSIDARLE